MINKYSSKVGDKVKYRNPEASSGNSEEEYIKTTVSVPPDSGPETAFIELADGSVATWNGNRYQVDGTDKILMGDQPMHEMTADDLKTLVHGDTVYRFVPYNDMESRRLRYVGRMPGSDNYLIFSDGEHLEHLYINERDKSFRGEWYSGEYDSVMFGNRIIAFYEKKLKTVRKIYLKEK